MGHDIKLTIREEMAKGEPRIYPTRKSLSESNTIFNLDNEKSKIFVGSFPVNYEMQKEIDVSSFEGEIEDLVIGNTPVSLWNFKEGYENNHGAKER